MPAANTQRSGSVNASLFLQIPRLIPLLCSVWEPLRLIVYGYAIHPLSPSSRRDTRLSPGRLSVVTEDSREDNMVHRDIVSLEVGDEIYAFERYIPRGKEVEGVWYRG